MRLFSSAGAQHDRALSDRVSLQQHNKLEDFINHAVKRMLGISISPFGSVNLERGQNAHEESNNI